MSIDKRVERNTQSVLALRELLRDIANNPASYASRDDLHQSLRSQGAIAKFNDESLGIYTSSLNTIKRSADAILEGGFDALDRLRTSAQEALAREQTKSKRSNKSNKIGLIKRVKELENENQQLRQDMLLLTLVFEKSLAQGKNYALKSDKDIVVALCKREQRELLDMMSLRQQPIGTNVLSFNESKEKTL